MIILSPEETAHVSRISVTKEKVSCWIAVFLPERCKAKNCLSGNLDQINLWCNSVQNSGFISETNFTHCVCLETAYLFVKVSLQSSSKQGIKKCQHVNQWHSF